MYNRLNNITMKKEHIERERESSEPFLRSVQTVNEYVM